jgi:hypothetical protein
MLTFRILSLSLFACSGVLASAATETTAAEGGAPTTTTTSDRGDDLTEESLLATIQDARALLQHGISSSHEKNKTISQQMTEFVQHSERLTNYHSTLETQLQKVDQLVSLANAKQVEHLIGRLRETQEKEVKLRAPRPEQEDAKVVVETEINEQVMEFVSMNDLKRRFETEKVMNASEAELKAWMLRIVEEELAAYKATALASPLPQGDDDGDCPSATDIVQDVQVALTKFSHDGIGLVDHAQGGEIVHSMTSHTYVPPPEGPDLLGNVWWRKYIPEDWERMLPPGWETWNTAIPSYVYHSLVRSCQTTIL